MKDLEKVENNPKFKINMNSWYHNKLDGKCHVCAAGAVMAGTLKVPKKKTCDGGYSTREMGHNEDALEAIDLLRSGLLFQAFCSLGISMPPLATRHFL